MLEFFKTHPEILAVMSERADGSLKIFPGRDLNLENREKFFRKIGIELEMVVAAEVVHGNKAVIVKNTEEKIILGADSLVAQKETVYLSVTVADCVPVFFYEPVHKIFGLAHCGWRGIAAGVVLNTLSEIFALGGRVSNLKIALGPALGACHFEIKKDVAEKFRDYPESIVRKEGKIFLDMKKILRRQLQEVGIKAENVEDDSACTFESEKYFSFRRDKPKEVEAMVAVIGLKNRVK